MRFLTILEDLDYRGTQRVAQNYSIALSELGHEVAVLALNRGGNREIELKTKDIPIWIGGDKLQEALYKAKDFQAKIIHIHRAGIYQPIWGQVLRYLKKSETTVLETNVFGRVDYSKDSNLIDLHMQISKWCLWRWNKWLGPRGQIGTLLPNPVDTTVFSPDNRPKNNVLSVCELNLSNYFVCGRIGKWHPCIFNAFKQLLRAHPNSIMISVSDHIEVNNYISELPSEIKSHIHIIPKLQNDFDLVDFYTSLDCLLQVSSNGESFGMVLAESMACGTPVVTASTPIKDNAQVEVVQHGDGGIVAGTKNNIGSALIAYCNDVDLQKKCSSQCRQLITERFDTYLVAKRLELIANYAINSNNNEELLLLLNEDKQFVTHVSDMEISQSLKNTYGGINLSELAIMNAVNNPHLYYLYQRIKNLFQ